MIGWASSLLIYVADGNSSRQCILLFTPVYAYFIKLNNDIHEFNVHIYFVEWNSAKISYYEASVEQKSISEYQITQYIAPILQ